MQKAIYLLVVGLFLTSSLVAEEEPPQRLKIELSNARFQALPEEVHRVSMGPDGRLWFNLDYSMGGQNLDNLSAFKKRMEKEFTKTSPQFYGGDLALFEPSGKVWFYLPRLNVILGYDGKTWDEYVILNPSDRVVGYCPTRGGYTAGKTNRFAKNSAWFVCARGVLRFDGKNWSSQRMDEDSAQGGRNHQENILLAASADGKTVAACLASVPMKSSKFWLFQKDRWISRPVETSIPQNRGDAVFMGIALSDANTLWLQYNTGMLEQVALGCEEEIQAEVKDISDLIRQLNDDSFATRQRATRDLMAMGPAIKPQLEAALKQQPDAELDYRLKLILQSFQPKPATLAVNNRTGVSLFGNIQVAAVRQLFQDPTGKVGVFAQSIRDAKSHQGPGFAILENKQDAKAIFLPSPTSVINRFTYENMPVVSASGRQIWWPSNLTGEAVQMYDDKIDEFTDTAPMPLYGGVQAVSNEGNVYLAKFNTTPGDPIMVYTPDAPETRTLLTMEKFPMYFPQFALADDGAIWAVQREDNPIPRPNGNWGGRLARYDGKEWHTLDTQPSQMIQSITPGKGGVMLVQNHMEAILYRGEKEIASGDLVDIIEKNREVFKESFGPDSPNISYDPNSQQTTQVIADKAGNIWRREESGRLLVLIGDNWVLAHEPLVAAGSPSGMVWYITTIGDGQKIYGCDQSRGMPNKLEAYFGEVKDGKLIFAPAPRIEIRDKDSLKVRDTDGSIWGFANMKELNGNYRQQLICLNVDGIHEKLEITSNPRLVDAAGNLWIDKGAGPAGCVYQIRRKGEYLGEILLANVKRQFPIFSDKPGSVYTWTNHGLQHLVADGPDFKKYRLGKLYSIDNLSGEVQSLVYSKQGFVVVLMQGGSNHSPYTLGVVKLPEEKNENSETEKESNQAEKSGTI
jgi:hypothetical protein